MIDLIILGVIVLIIVIVLLWIITTYNAFVQIEKQVQNSWAQIDVQLKRQADLIPNLVETVKGYAKFEKKVLTDVTKARTAIMSAKTPAQAARGENMLSGALKSIFAVAESYPKLQASENFKALQEELSSTANKVAFARQFYNDMVMKWNTLILQFPSNVLANMFGKNKEKESFEASASERKNTKVDFSDLSK